MRISTRIAVLRSRSCGASGRRTVLSFPIMRQPRSCCGRCSVNGRVTTKAFSQCWITTSIGVRSASICASGPKVTFCDGRSMIPNQVSDKESVVNGLVAAPLLRSLIATDPRVVALSFGPKKNLHVQLRLARRPPVGSRKPRARRGRSKTVRARRTTQGLSIAHTSGFGWFPTAPWTLVTARRSCLRKSAISEGSGCRPFTGLAARTGPASGSLRRRNPRNGVL